MASKKFKVKGNFFLTFVFKRIALACFALDCHTKEKV